MDEQTDSQSTGKEKRNSNEYSDEERRSKKIKTHQNKGSQNRRISHWQPPLKFSPEKSALLAENDLINEASNVLTLDLNQFKADNEDGINNNELSGYVGDSYTSGGVDCDILGVNNKLSLSLDSEASTAPIERSSESPVGFNYCKEENVACSSNMSRISSLETLPMYSQHNTDESSDSQYSIQEEVYVKSRLLQKTIQLGLNCSNENMNTVTNSSDPLPSTVAEETDDYDSKKYNESLTIVRALSSNLKQSQAVDTKNDSKNKFEIHNSINQQRDVTLDNTNVEPEEQINPFSLSTQKPEIMSSLSQPKENIDKFPKMLTEDRTVLLGNNIQENRIRANSNSTPDRTSVLSFNVQGENAFKLPENPKQNPSSADNIDDSFESGFELSNSQLQQIEKQFSKPKSGVSRVNADKQNCSVPSSQNNRVVHQEKIMLQKIIKEVEALNDMVLKLRKDIISQMNQPTRK